MNRDFVEMLAALYAAGVEFLIVGAYAMAAHGLPRATGDIDIWVRPTRANAERVMRALQSFGAPLFDLTIEDLLRLDTVFQISIAPSRIDILTGITGVSFKEAWSGRAFRLRSVATLVRGPNRCPLRSHRRGARLLAVPRLGAIPIRRPGAGWSRGKRSRSH